VWAAGSLLASHFRPWPSGELPSQFYALILAYSVTTP
jgi:hypothetical protein